MNELIKKVEELSEEKLELKAIEDFQTNIGSLKEIFKAVFDKSKETQEFINKLDLAQIVESSMEYLQDEFYDKFVPPMKALEKMIKNEKDSAVGKELADLRKQLQRRIIDAQAIFSDTIGKTPYKLEQMESLQTIRKKLIPQLEKQTDKLNKNVDGIEEEIYEELSNNYKSLLGILRSLKLEIEAINKQLEENKAEVEKLASSSAWIKEQLAQREIELAEKDKEAGEIKAELEAREKELQSVRADLDKQLEEKAAESKKIEEMLAKREKELEALKTETKLSKAELKKRREALEEQISKTRKELEEKASESEEIKFQLVQREKELMGTIETTKMEMESTASAIEATQETKQELEKIVIEKDKEIERIKTELEEQKITITKKEKEITEITRQLKETKTFIVEKEQEISETKKVLTTKIEEVEVSKVSEAETTKLKDELNDLLQFLEKSPRYQLLFLINNKETITLNKIQDLFKFDIAVTRSILDDLKERKFISYKEIDEELTIKIEQKLNPLSCIELQDIFENQLFKELESKTEMKSLLNSFDTILEKITQYKKSNKQEAGFLLSLLYLYIYDSKRFEFFSKIRDLYDELKPHSFYLRLIENALTHDSWESKKAALLENLSEFPTINILNKEFKNLSSEEMPTDGPFSVNKFRPLSLIDWEKETIVNKSDLNQHVDLTELAKWVWLNGKGSSFTVEIENSKGQKLEIIVTASKCINELLITKHYELIAG